MKKLTAILLSSVLMFSSAGVTAFAADGPKTEPHNYVTDDGEDYYQYDAFISFDEYDEHGLPKLSPEGIGYTSHYVFFDNTVYNEDNGEEYVPGIKKGLSGVKYDILSNTLTLDNLNKPMFALSTNAMGDDFKLEIKGECKLGSITVFGNGWGGSLDIQGDGTLTVNENKIFDKAIVIDGENTDASLNFGKNVNVNLYGQTNAVSIIDSTAESLYTAENGSELPEIEVTPYTFERLTWVYSYTMIDFDDPENEWSYEEANAAINSADPENIYAVKENNYTDDEDVEYTTYEIFKLVYSEKFDAYFADPDFEYKAYEDDSIFNKNELTLEEFKDSPFSIVNEEEGSVRFYSEGYGELSPLYEDSEGNSFIIVTDFSGDEPVEYAASVEPVEGLNDTYVYTIRDDVDIDSLNEIFEVIVSDTDNSFELKTTEFHYTGLPVDGNVTYGDVNGDGNINLADRIILTRYLAGWEAYQNINSSNADVNADGNINIADRMVLTRHLAGWDSYSTLPFKR